MKAPKRRSKRLQVGDVVHARKESVTNPHVSTALSQQDTQDIIAQFTLTRRQPKPVSRRLIIAPGEPRKEALCVPVVQTDHRHL